MADEDLTIQPKPVRLAHHDDARTDTAQPARSTRLPWMLLGAIVLGAVAIFALLPEPGPASVPPSVSAPNSGAGRIEPNVADPGGSEESVAPFEEVQREKARRAAQAALNDFVKLQLKLEDDFNVEQWGQEALQAAISTANEGDERFLNADYEPALERYEAGRDQLKDLLRDAETTYRGAISDGLTAVIELDQPVAQRHVELALTLKPTSRDALDLQRRTAEIPRIIATDAEARGFEVEQLWSDALAALERLQDIEPLFPGLDDRLSRAREEILEIEYQEVLTQAFAALNKQAFGDARTYFNQALALKPGNRVALGGLQQVQAFTEVRRIDRLRQRAESQMVDEAWTDAIETFDEMLELEPALQFARQGRTDARQRASVEQILGRIIASPEKLSAPKLFEEATSILATAQGLPDRGPRLDRKTRAVADLLEVYSKAVMLRLTSDNATSIAITSHGRLGTFFETSVELRPGRYTIMGSRDGCRDIRKDIMVLPGIEPVDIRCEETL